jgi:GAF domain-containing protein
MPEDADSVPAQIKEWSIPGLHSLCDHEVRGLLAEFLPLLNASELALWVKDPDGEQLVALLDTLGPGGPVELKLTQPLQSGIISQVYRDQEAFLDRGLWRSKAQSPLVDQALGQSTVHEMCVPFHLSGRLIGVLCAVQLSDGIHQAPARWGFTPQDLAILKVAALAASLAMERAWFAQSAG